MTEKKKKGEFNPRIDATGDGVAKVKAVEKKPVEEKEE